MTVARAVAEIEDCWTCTGARRKKIREIKKGEQKGGKGKEENGPRKAESEAKQRLCSIVARNSMSLK
jgi:hypothetical protein